MKVELDDVAFWMDAIRNSDDRYRTLESFWKGQLKSKVWLAETLRKCQKEYQTWDQVTVYGGWNGVLASLLFNSGIRVKHVTSVDIDPACEEVAYTINKRYEMTGCFNAVTADMTEYQIKNDVAINTSCEHITQEQYEQWLSNQTKNTLIVLQSNNYTDLDEHIRCPANGDEFLHQSKIKPFWRGEMKLEKYTRFMIIGKKNV